MVSAQRPAAACRRRCSWHTRTCLLEVAPLSRTAGGFGAIAPVSKAARTLADLEAVVGTLYIAVVLARLVSLQITHAGADVSRRTG